MFYRVVKPHLHSRMLENFSLQTLNDLLWVGHCKSLLFGSTLLSKSYNKTTRDICRFVLFRKSHKSLTQSDLHIGFFSCTILLVTRQAAALCGRYSRYNVKSEKYRICYLLLYCTIRRCLWRLSLFVDPGLKRKSDWNIIWPELNKTLLWWDLSIKTSSRSQESFYEDIFQDDIYLDQADHLEAWRCLFTKVEMTLQGI